MHSIDRVVMNAILDYVMSMRLHHRNLGCHGLVFTSRLLVEVVRYQNVHRAEIRAETAFIRIKFSRRRKRLIRHPARQRSAGKSVRSSKRALGPQSRSSFPTPHPTAAIVRSAATPMNDPTGGTPRRLRRPGIAKSPR